MQMRAIFRDAEESDGDTLNRFPIGVSQTWESDGETQKRFMIGVFQIWENDRETSNSHLREGPIAGIKHDRKSVFGFLVSASPGSHAIHLLVSRLETKRRVATIK
ncbi:unnamed protein product, partial [Cuscuta epithymum]